MNVLLTMSATRTPNVQTQTVATRAVVLTVTREMERTVQVNVPEGYLGQVLLGMCRWPLRTPTIIVYSVASYRPHPENL